MEAHFHSWLWRLVARFGPDRYRINRNHGEGEHRGFHPVWYGYADAEGVATFKYYPGVNGIPGVRQYADLWFKRPKERPSQRLNAKHGFKHRQWYDSGNLYTSTDDDEEIHYPIFENMEAA
jgi:hypothetical protein